MKSKLFVSSTSNLVELYFFGVGQVGQIREVTHLVLVLLQHLIGSCMTYIQPFRPAVLQALRLRKLCNQPMPVPALPTQVHQPTPRPRHRCSGRGCAGGHGR